jgi:hypothetical protein
VDSLDQQIITEASGGTGPTHIQFPKDKTIPLETCSASRYGKFFYATNASTDTTCTTPWVSGTKYEHCCYCDSGGWTKATCPDVVDPYGGDFGWPTLASGTPCADDDSDGMPDAFEQDMYVDNAPPGDGSEDCYRYETYDSDEDCDSDDLTDLEEYTNGRPCAWCEWADIGSIADPCVRDGNVGTADYYHISDQWGESCDEDDDWCGCADINRDGTVGSLDYPFIVTWWGESCYPGTEEQHTGGCAQP